MNDISNMEANNSLVIQTEIRREALRFFHHSGRLCIEAGQYLPGNPVPTV